MGAKTREDLGKKKELALSASPYVYLPVDVPVYTVEVCHREEINGDLLQQALDRTVQRMPYLTDTLVAEETGKVWYAENPLPMQAAHTAELRRVGGRETNYHMLDLTWDENKTWFSMFHGFCDGQGISAFLETVLYYYYCLKDGKTYDPNGILMRSIRVPSCRKKRNSRRHTTCRSFLPRGTPVSGCTACGYPPGR